MRKNNTYIILVSWMLLVLCGAPGLRAEGIRIRPQSVKVENDSLRIHLLMDLNSVHASRGVAYIFTPFLRGKGKHLELPPVIVSGSRRARFDRRERVLKGQAGDSEPYRIVVDNRKQPSKEITYRIAIPYASWMGHASLALMQESKNCCVKRILSVDTLTPDIAATGSPADESNSLQLHPEPVSSPAVAPERGATPLLSPQPAVSSAISPVTTPEVLLPAAPYIIPSVTAVSYASMVSYLEPAQTSREKRRSQGITLYIDYPLNKYEVYLDYRNNRHEVEKIDSFLRPVLTNGFSVVDRIRIRGYASPDGNYGDNERLSSNRSRQFMYYVRDAYGIPEKLFDVSWVAEDWEETEELLNKQRPAYYRAAIDIIHRYGIFQGREKQLMDLQGGAPYKDMLRNIFPRLRRIELVVESEIRQVNGDEATELLYTQPELLSLEEIYRAARYYRPGTEQYREVYEIAAYRFPSEVVANVNAASAVMLTGDLRSAWGYLRKVEGNPKAWNNMGVLTLMEGNPEGAAEWFRKAVGVEPRKARTNLQIAEEMMRKNRMKRRGTATVRDKDK